MTTPSDVSFTFKGIDPEVRSDALVVLEKTHPRTPGQLVKEFHEAYGMPVKEKFEPLSPERLKLRLKLNREEYNEVLDAVDDNDPVNLVKELNDLIYVATGMLLELGADPDKTMAEVHRANMSKLGEDGQPVRRADGKILKGPNYVPADIASVLSVV